MTPCDYSIVVFSFNRGAHLENCVASIDRHAPRASVRIIDDDSDDPDTCAILERLAVDHDVLVCRESEPTGSKVGGLYPNMQRALDDLPDGRLFSFFQDDMQMVRDLEPEDLDTMQGFFEADARNAFIGHAFLRGYRRASIGPDLRLDPATSTYRRELPKGGWGAWFSAIHTSRTDRLREAGYRYASSEKLNDALAGEQFNRLGMLCNPIATCLPAVPVHRHKSKTWSQGLAGRLGQEGLYRVVPLSDAEVNAMRSRDLDHALPWSEDFLITDPPAPQNPWTYSGFQGRRWLKHLHRIELGLRRVGSRLSAGKPR